jgi:ribosomal protein L12E/L44/L45/RPP1/RPP2
MSPQQSDDSFDIVSSGQASAANDAGAAPVHTKAKETSSDGNEEEDGEGEEEEEEESDWE